MKKVGLIKLLVGLTLVASGAFAVGSGLSHKKVESVNAEYSQGSVIANDKARIWIGYDTSNPFYSYADDNTGIRLWIHSTSSGGSELVFGTISGTFNNSAQSNRRYDYFDVDLSVYTNQWYMTVQKFQDGNWKGQTNSIQLTSSNACMVYFVWGDWAWDSTAGTVAAGSIDSVDAGLAAKALGGLHTCSSNNINGYNAFANYDSTFVHDGENWKTSGNLSDYELTDFATGNTSYTGNPATTVNAYTKYQNIQSMYTTGHLNSSRLLSQNLTTNKNTWIIIIVCLVSVSAIGGYFFIKKRREY